LRFIILYRFQGSVLTLRSPARVSLCILSSSQRKVNRFFQLFSPFWLSFWNCERFPKASSPAFRLWDGHLSPVFPKIVRSFGRCFVSSFLQIYLTFPASSDIIRTDVLIVAESTWL